MADCRFEIKDKFYLDQKEMKVISGGLHYFRVVPQYWRDRLIKLKNLGCNTIETYIPWNLHEENKGEFNFEGRLDLKAFLLLAQELGLWVIARPSPYICAEWEFGGLPAWLLADDSMRLRGYYQPFLDHLRDYYKELFKILAPLQIDSGGPIIMMQLENEYGYYGNDTKYLETLKQIMIDNKTVVPMITSDGPWGDSISCGSLPGVLPTANFGSKAVEQFEVLSEYTKGRPLMCMEFWVGWFDAWGDKTHQTGNLQDNIKNLRDILRLGNVNIYMFQGGTNFGFMNGSNYYGALTPDVTSYDYDALLTEGGAITPKYDAFKKVIQEFTTINEMPLEPQVVPTAYGKLSVCKKVDLFHALEDLTSAIESTYTKSMERVGQNYGYILYRTILKKENKLEKIRLLDANDRVQVFVDQKPVVTLYDRELLTEADVEAPLQETNQMDILVENMGRVNFGPLLENQRKGINRGVQINGHQHFVWKHYPLPLNNIDRIDFSRGYQEGVPAFYQFEFDVANISDTYLDFTGWGKGCAFINGFHLGRFWQIGPQKRLYLPGPLLKKGKNTIIMFETEGITSDCISLMSEPDIG
ncbi:MAG: glycoside hydrolase family 35 protein [Mobilitalea sp.]